MRRATFDLTGLPPTPDEVEAFLADQSPDAFAKVVDRLLASPQYGERWGRHWLDVARYADCGDARGSRVRERPRDLTEAWRYRDWVVAGDEPRPALRPVHHRSTRRRPARVEPATPERLNVDGQIATGFLAIGAWGNGDADKEKMLTDIVDDQLNATSRAFLGSDGHLRPLPRSQVRSDSDRRLLLARRHLLLSTHFLPNPGNPASGVAQLRTPIISQAERDRRQAAKAQVAEVQQRLKEAATREYQQASRGAVARRGALFVGGLGFSASGRRTAAAGVDKFAAERDLRPDVLQRSALWLSAGETRLLSRWTPNANGVSGLHSWKLNEDTPGFSVNTNDAALAFSTIKMPPRSVSVHPGPTTSVAVVWASPITGKVRILGRAADIDPNCGDGIDWKLEQQTSFRRANTVASGRLANGAASDILRSSGSAVPPMMRQ